MLYIVVTHINVTEGIVFLQIILFYFFYLLIFIILVIILKIIVCYSHAILKHLELTAYNTKVFYHIIPYMFLDNYF
jgi:hypothetical protein